MNSDHKAIYSKCRDGHGPRWQALMLLEDLQQRFLSSDVVTCNACISACETSETWQRALGLLGLLSATAAVASLITYNAALSACKVMLGWVAALELLALLLRSRTSPESGDPQCSNHSLLHAVAMGILHISSAKVDLQDAECTKMRCTLHRWQTSSPMVPSSQRVKMPPDGEVLLDGWRRWSSVICSRMSWPAIRPMSACEKASQWQQSWCLLMSLRGGPQVGTPNRDCLLYLTLKDLVFLCISQT